MKTSTTSNKQRLFTIWEDDNTTTEYFPVMDDLTIPKSTLVKKSRHRSTFFSIDDDTFDQDQPE